MKITQSQLRQIIKEELDNVLQEDVMEKIQAIVKSGDVPKEKNAFMDAISKMGARIRSAIPGGQVEPKTKFGRLLGFDRNEEREWEHWRNTREGRKYKGMDDLEVLRQMVSNNEMPETDAQRASARAARAKASAEDIARAQASHQQTVQRGRAILKRAEIENARDKRRKEMRAQGYFEDPENPGEYMSSADSSARYRARRNAIDDKNYRAAMREALREGNAEEFKTQLLNIIRSGK